MKLSAGRDAFADAVAWAASVLHSRPSMPVLAGLRFTAAEGMLTVAGFDQDSAATASLPAEVGEPGEVLLAGRLLKEIAAKLPAGKAVTLEMADTDVILACGAAEFRLSVLPLKDYPTLPVMPETVGTVGSAAFADAVARVSVAVDPNSPVSALAGILLDAGEDGTLVLAGTTGTRLSIQEIAWNPDTMDGVAALVPARNMPFLAKAMAASDVITIGVSDNLAGFSGAGRTLTTRLIAEPFPPYRNQVFVPDATATVDVAEWASAVQRVALLAEEDRPVYVSLTRGEAEVTAVTRGRVNAREALSVTWDGGPVTIAFNPHFLLDGLLAAGAEQAVLGLRLPESDGGPVRVLRGVSITPSGGDGSVFYVTMPVRDVD